MDTMSGGGLVSRRGENATPSSRRRLRSAAVTTLCCIALASQGLLAAEAQPQPSIAGTDSDPTPTQPQPAAPDAPSGPPDDALVRFHSRPDLRPPTLRVTADPAEVDEEVFLTPRYGGAGEGVMIFDGQGRLVWLHRVPGRSAVALKPIIHAGQPALSWWEGVVERGLGDGDFVIAGPDYREIARIRSVRHPADLHELVVTPAGTAYVFAMDVVELDGQPVDDMLVQEVDIESGRLLWEWRASDHISTDESVVPAPDEGPWDYLHFNSIDQGPDGDLLLSARHTDALYRVARESGEILWRLGGTHSDFELTDEAVFHKQHDARWLPDGTISLFDNSTKDADDPDARPRGVVLAIDEDAGTAELVRELLPPRAVDSSSQGSFTIDDDGSATIGWGSGNLVTGYDDEGDVTWDGAMPPGFSSYRAYRADWHGQPLDDPLLSVTADEPGDVIAWASWNGATEVATWELLAGSGPDALTSVTTQAADGFETALPVPADAAVIAVRALDAGGAEMGRSAALGVAIALAAPASPG